MAAILVKVEAKTVAKTLHYVNADALFDTHPDKLSVVVAKSIADGLTLLGVEPPFKTVADILAYLKASPCLETLNKVAAEAVVNTPARSFSKSVVPECCQHPKRFKGRNTFRHAY